MRRALLASLLAFWLSAVPATAAHHFAETLSEVDHNTETRSLEWALSMSASDLEWILSRRARRDVSLEKTEGVEGLIQDYLKEVVRVWAPDGTELDLTWVGKELEVQRVWLYFEFALPKTLTDLAGVKLSNRVLLRWERDQVNRLTLRAAPAPRSLTFTRKTPTHLLTPEPPPPTPKRRHDTVPHTTRLGDRNTVPHTTSPGDRDVVCGTVLRGSRRSYAVPNTSVPNTWGSAWRCAAPYSGGRSQQGEVRTQQSGEGRGLRGGRG